MSVVRRIQKVFPSFDCTKLNDVDLEMWRAVKSGKAAREYCEAYLGSILKDEGRDATTLSSSRLMFSDFLGDIMQEVQSREYFNKTKL